MKTNLRRVAHSHANVRCYDDVPVRTKLEPLHGDGPAAEPTILATAIPTRRSQHPAIPTFSWRTPQQREENCERNSAHRVCCVCEAVKWWFLWSFYRFRSEMRRYFFYFSFCGHATSRYVKALSDFLVLNIYNYKINLTCF